LVVCLVRGADLHMAQRVPLPLTVSCSSKIQIGFTFLVPAHPGSPGQRDVKWMCVCVCVSGTTWVSQYQKKHSPTHTHEEEEGFAQATRSALSQQGWSNPIKPAYNQRWPDGWFKLTVSAFNRLCISTLTVLVAVPTVMQN